ncbi:MAG: hypothetical protein II328_03965, partial [Clostridia bacterium]|nr:hypothetical protein [Clostridia bacterium]
MFFSSFFSGEQKEAKKSRSEKKRALAENAPKHRARFGFLSSFLFRRTEKKQKKSQDGEKAASHTKRPQTTRAFCDKLFSPFFPLFRRKKKQKKSRGEK